MGILRLGKVRSGALMTVAECFLRHVMVRRYTSPVECTGRLEAMGSIGSIIEHVLKYSSPTMLDKLWRFYYRLWHYHHHSSWNFQMEHRRCLCTERKLFAKKIRGYNGLHIGGESKMKVGPYTKRLRDHSWGKITKEKQLTIDEIYSGSLHETKWTRGKYGSSIVSHEHQGSNVNLFQDSIRLFDSS